LDKSIDGSKGQSASLKTEDMTWYPVRCATQLSCGDTLKWSNGAMITGKKKIQEKHRKNGSSSISSIKKLGGSKN
jgi:hypothetical protein